MDNPKRSILFVLSSFFPHHRAGTEKYVLTLAKGLMRKGWEVEVAIPVLSDVEDYVFDEIPVHTYRVSTQLNLKEEFGSGIMEGEAGFTQILDQVRPNIVHFHTLLSRTIPMRFALIAKNMVGNVFVTPHLGGFFCLRGDYLQDGKEACNGEVHWRKCGSCFFKGKSNLYKFLPKPLVWFGVGNQFLGARLPIKRERDLKALSESGIHFIAISKWIYEVFNKNNFTKVHKVLQGVPNVVQPNLVRAPLQNGLVKLLFVGRITPSKGLDLIIQSALKLSKLQSVHLTVLGIPDPDYLDFGLNQRKAVEQIKGWIWKEMASFDEVQSAMWNHDLLVLPSRSNEMAPLVILEAINAGLPVIGSSLRAVKEMIEHYQCGWVFEMGRENALLEVLKTATEQEEYSKVKEGMPLEGRSDQDVVQEQEAIYLTQLV